MISGGEHPMRHAKRLFYIVLLNIIISAITIGVVLQLWEKDHPLINAESTPVVIVVTATEPGVVPISGNEVGLGAITPVDSGIAITSTQQVAPTIEMLTYRVKEGDILGALAVQFNASVADIIAVNNLTDPDSLIVGQIIYIPTAPLPRVTSTSIPPTFVASATPRASATPTHGPASTATPTSVGQEAQVVIDQVIGVGVLENERVVILRTGDGELSMAGWRLTDGQGNNYILPQLTLYKDSAININTRTGQNSVVDLFWCLPSAVWSPGKVVSIYDAQNNLRATYTVP
jgi:LysM repeat protein